MKYLSDVCGEYFPTDLVLDLTFLYVTCSKKGRIPQVDRAG